MRTVSIKLKDMAIANIQLGFVGENNATQVIFECKEIFDENPYAVQLLVVTPPEGTSYEVTTARIGDNVIWNVSELDTAFEGDGSIQLVFTDGSQVIKTYNADTTVLESQVPSGTAPATALNWIQDAEAWAKGTRGGRAVEDDDPTYQNNSKYYSDKIVNMASDSEAWAKGTRDGEAVESDDPAYQNNSKYYAESIADTASDSEAYAAGTRGGEAVDEDDPAYHNNAAYYNEQAALEKAAAQAAAETASAAYNVNLLADNYDATKLYAVGEYCIYNGGYKRCIVPITTAEAWTSAHWADVTVGKDLSALKSAFDVVNTSELVVNDIGIRLSEGYGADELAVLQCIDYIKVTGINRSASDVDIQELRITMCINSVSYPKRLRIISSGGSVYTLDFGDSETKSATLNLGQKRVTVEAKFNWSKYGSVASYNKTYDNSKIVVIGSNSSYFDNKISNRIDLLSETATDIANIGNKIASTIVSSTYINFDGSITAYANHDNLKIKVYPVNKGDTVILKGDSVKLSAAYPLAVLADAYTTGTYGDIIIYGDSTAKNYHFIYTADKSGYLIVSYRSDDGFGELNVYDLFDAGVFLQTYLASTYTKITGTLYSNTFINNNRKIDTTTASYSVKKYAVEANKPYRVYGESVALNTSLYPIACFSTTEYTGESALVCSSDVITAGETGTAKNYDFVYTPSANGYVYVNRYSTNNTVDLYEGANSRTESALINKLTGTNTEDPVKLQAFGDSITDDSWRTDQTTWLTLFPALFPQRTWIISNDAVGGSHMGHGKVSSETGKYHELEYNWVYDLITNANIFKPESDIIVIAAGTNDFNSFPLGQYGDSDTSTFYGSVKCVCEYLSEHTAAKVFFSTPIARPTDADSSKSTNADGEKINAYGATLRDYADAIKRTCAFYQFPVIDLFYEIGWNATNVKPYMDAVGVHPNTKGSKVISQYIVGKIKQHLAL